MSTQTLKSANVVRVDPARAYSLAAASRDLGEPLMCAAGSPYLSHDIYGRPAGQNTLSVNLDASCGQLSQYNVARHLDRETLERPYVALPPSGLRGAGDFSGRGIQDLPQGLYENSVRGNIVRHYKTPNNAPPENYMQASVPVGSVLYSRVERPFDFSHDATSRKSY